MEIVTHVVKEHHEQKEVRTSTAKSDKDVIISSFVFNVNVK